ncbi:MAG: UbiD family decarboxylase [Chloroflexi bacterium]|nr:UbiD family decarboxylase [Chloroflexota bacterium]
MAYKGLREFIQKLEDEGELLRITEQVDWNLEIGAVARRLCDLETKGQSVPAVLFENVKDYPGGKFFTNSLASYRRYALALGMDKNSSRLDLVHAFEERINHPIPPVVVDKKDAPCKENILLGDDIDVFKFPVPKWHERDGHRYLGTFHASITKDLESDWVNWGMYRVGIHDKNTVGFNIPPGGLQNANIIHNAYLAQGKRMPVVLAMGDDPVLPIVAAGMFPVGCSEVEMAGALRQAPYELVKAETCDLMVPANAEIIIEGYVDPGDMRTEGPFGEYTGYYGSGAGKKPVLHITCITHRNDPILIGSQEGVPFVDDHYMASISMSALARHHLRDVLKFPIVKEVFYHPAANWDFCVVSVNKDFDGVANTIAHGIWCAKFGYHTGSSDWVIVVDEDVDPSDINQVLWALVTRTNPSEDIHIVKRKGAVNFLAPNTLLENRRKLLSGSSIVIDAGWPFDWKISHKESIPLVSNWEEWDEKIREAAAAIVDRNLK